MAISAQLRQDTTMTLKPIAEHQAMDSWGDVATLLRLRRKQKK